MTQSITKWLKENMSKYSKNDLFRECSIALGCKEISVRPRYNALRRKMYALDIDDTIKSCLISPESLKAKYDIGSIIKEGILKYLSGGMMLENDFINCLFEMSDKKISKSKIKKGMSSNDFDEYYVKSQNKIYWGNKKDVIEVKSVINQYR